MADTVTEKEKSGPGVQVQDVDGKLDRWPYPENIGKVIITRTITETIKITKTIYRDAVPKQPEPKIKPLIENFGIVVLSIETVLVLLFSVLWMTYLGFFIDCTNQSTPDDRVDNIDADYYYRVYNSNYSNSYPDSHDAKEKGDEFCGTTFVLAVELVLILPLVIGILRDSFEFCTIWFSFRLVVFIYEFKGFVLLCANLYEWLAIVVTVIYLLYRIFSIAVIFAFGLSIYRSRFRVGQVGTVDV